MGRAEVDGTPARDAALDVELVVSPVDVRLAGAGVDVVAPHSGMPPSLVDALSHVRRARTRANNVRLLDRDLDAVSQGPGSVSVRRAGELLAESFLPGPVSAALAQLVRRAVRDTVALRIGVRAPDWLWLPWEAVPEPVTGQPLALHPQVVVYRRTDAQAPAHLAGPLRIVVAIASPDHGGVLLDYERELRAVLEAVGGARRHQARVEVVPFATTAAIRMALNGVGAVHVLHISCHGVPGAWCWRTKVGRPGR